MGSDDDGNMFPDADVDEDNAEAPAILPAQPASNETYQKSVSVKNQLEIWEKLLEVRIKSHKLLLTANSLPLPDAHDRLTKSEEFANAAEKTFQGVEKLLTQLQSFQQLMCSRFPETKELTLTPAGKKRKSTSKAAPESKVQRLDTAASAVAENYSTFWTYSQPVLQKWHDRTNVIAISKAKHAAGSANLLKNIEDSMINRTELVKKTRAYRGGYDVFDWKNSLHLFTNDEGNCITEADLAGDGLQDPANKLACSEIFDDSDFYHQLLRELIQSKTEEGQGQLEIAKKYQELQKLRGKMKKTVDTRASKGRKIR
jgi:protein AATF/BFR2